MNRIANGQDREEMIPLWRETFGDDKEFVQWAMEDYAGFEHVYVAHDDGKLAASLLAVPCNCNTIKGTYMFSLATNPQFQKQGIMTSLLEFAHQQEQEAGADFAALIPANGSLYSFYEKRGYTQTLHLRQVNIRIDGNLFAKAAFDTLTAGRFVMVREKFLPQPAIAFSARQLSGILKDLYSSGAETAETEQGYAIYFCNKENISIVEMGAVAGGEVALLQAIREKTGLANATVTVSDNSNLFLGQGTLMPNAMICKFKEGLALEKAYLRLAFEEMT